MSSKWSAYSKLEGFLLVPHELLHLVGYRLVGKRCRYHLGDPFVTPLGQLKRRERLVGLLFPFAVFVTLFFLLAIVSGLMPIIFEASPELARRWGLSLGVLSLIAGGYVCTTVGDLRQAYRIYFDKDVGSQTPFDVFEQWQSQLQGLDRRLIYILIALCLLALGYTWLI